MRDLPGHGLHPKFRYDQPRKDAPNQELVTTLNLENLGFEVVKERLRGNIKHVFIRDEPDLDTPLLDQEQIDLTAATTAGEKF